MCVVVTRSMTKHTERSHMRRFVHIVAWIAALFFAALIPLNLHDYYVRTDLPWREGDFSQVMTKNTTGLVVSLAVLWFSRARRSR